MLSKKVVLRICAIISIISWANLLVCDLFSIVGLTNDLEQDLPFYIKDFLLTLYSLAIIIYFKLKYEGIDNVNFLELQWRAFFSGLITSIIALIIRFADTLFMNFHIMNNIYIANILYHILAALVIIFLVTAFISWKGLILYQKSSILLKTWNIFEYSLIISLILNFFHFNYLDYRLYIPFFFLLLLGIILSVNLKWVAYINFKQKWQSILLILLTLIYLIFILSTLSKFTDSPTLVIDITSSVFILSLFVFVAMYAVFSVLVILFNLPTSSVFEQKMEEVINFQRLSQSLQIGQKEDYVYEVLLESSLSTVLADAAWLEIYNEDDTEPVLLKRNITPNQISDFKEALISSGYEYIFDRSFGKNISKNWLDKKFKNLPYNSIVIIPIIGKTKKIGLLGLLKSLKDGFSKEMIDIVNAFVNQSAISIENFRLLAEAIKNERYKEELTIAKKLQKSLIPSDINQSDHYTIASFTESAEEVGGDYYDIYKYSENKTAFIIGDVSGKGTSAAFHMAQLKGVFHSLVQLDLSSQEFLIQANKALSRCLEKSSFITLTFFIVDLYHHNIELTRAGHCPALFYDSINKTVYYLNTRGLGLGIIRNSKFDNFNDVIQFAYNSNDIILLYTDGIVEAKNIHNEEYGYDRLKETLEKKYDLPPEKINQAIIEDLYSFCGKKKIDDDYTLAIIKFN